MHPNKFAKRAAGPLIPRVLKPHDEALTWIHLSIVTHMLVGHVSLEWVSCADCHNRVCCLNNLSPASKISKQTQYIQIYALHSFRPFFTARLRLWVQTLIYWDLGIPSIDSHKLFPCCVLRPTLPSTHSRQGRKPYFGEARQHCIKKTLYLKHLKTSNLSFKETPGSSLAVPGLGAKDPVPTQYMGPPHDPNPFGGPAWNDILLLSPSTESPHDISQQPLHDRGIRWIQPWYFHHSVSIALALLLLGLVILPEALSIQHMALEGYDAPNKVRVLPVCYTRCCSWRLVAPIDQQASEAAMPNVLLRQNPHHDKVHASWRQTRKVLRGNWLAQTFQNL